MIHAVLPTLTLITQDYKATQKTAKEREAASLPRPSPAQRAPAAPPVDTTGLDAASAADKAHQVRMRSV